MRLTPTATLRGNIAVTTHYPTGRETAVRAWQNPVEVRLVAPLGNERQFAGDVHMGGITC